MDIPEAELEDPSISAAAHVTDTRRPFDFNGSQSNGRGRGYETSQLSDGSHTVTAALDLDDGSTIVLNTSFLVHNGAPALLFTEDQVDVNLPRNGRASVAVPLLTTTGEATEVRITDDASWLKLERSPSNLTPGVQVVPEVIVLEIDTSGLAPGTYTASLTAQATDSAPSSASPAARETAAASTLESDTMTVTTTVESSTTTCSPLACSELLVDAPYELDFSQDHGKILDGSGAGTGFTYVQPTTNGTGYIPGNLALNTASPGILSLTTTDGIAYTSTDSQDNAIGVGIDAPSQVSILKTTLLNIPAMSSSSEQAGLWFGTDEDNYAKLVVISTSTGSKIQHLVEIGGVQKFSKVSGGLNLSNANVELTIELDPSDRSIKARYSVNGASTLPMGSFTLTPEMFSFDAAGIDPTIGTRSFGGIFATHRNASAPMTFSFDAFSLTSKTATGGGGTGFNFTRTSFPMSFPTSIAVGPDNRLYITELFGTIHRVTLDGNKQVVSDEVFTPIGSRLTLGITVDPSSTPDNVILWVAHSNDSTHAGQVNSGMITRLSGLNLDVREDIITGLPRAHANHATNSIHFGPDGRLYIAQGGNTGAGAPNETITEFGKRAEQPLSAALLVADVYAPGFDGSCATPEETPGPSPCDVQVYASGLRNMYDFVWHSNGQIYGPNNGLGVVGTYPPSPTPPCTGEADTSLHSPDDQPDFLNRLEQGKYYGHPNPYRNGNGWSPECVYGDGSYQGVAPLANYVPPILNLGDHTSSNGTIEYTSSAFNGLLKGQILIGNYSVGDNIVRVKLSPDGQTVVESAVLVGNFKNPLPIVQGADGTIFVGEAGADKVTALIPTVADTGPAGTWSSKQSMPASILDAGGTALDDKLYVVAGKNSTTHLKTVHIYDPAQNSWSPSVDLPAQYSAVENPAVVGYNGKLYVFGGSSGPFSGAVTSSAVFDPATATWTMLAPMDTGRGGATAQVIGDQIYIVGGMDSNGASLDSVEIYDPATNSWGAGLSMSTRRDNPGSAVVDNKLYIFGGRTRNADGTEVNGTLATVEMFDPATNAWTARASMPTGRRTMAVGTLNGLIQVMGGERKSDGTTFAENEEYNPTTNTWRTLSPMITPRHGTVSGTINGIVYVAGGGPVAGGSFTNVNEAFTFGDSTPPSAPTNLTAALSADETTVNLDWDDNSETDLSGYHVYRGASASGPFTRLTTARLSASAFSDSTAPAGTTVYYHATAVDESGNQSGPSNVVSALRPTDTTPPAIPANLATSAVPGAISLDWDDNTDSDLAGYHVYRKSGTETTFTRLTPSVVTTSAYPDATAPSGVLSTYRVTAVDTSNNESGPSNESGITRPASSYSVVYSLQSNRSNPFSLNGATVKGNIYVFTAPVTADIVLVRFYLDDPTMTGTPRRIENSAPYDFIGGTNSSATALNTTTLSEGSHTITAAFEFSSGGVDVVHATFTVQNIIGGAPTVSITNPLNASVVSGSITVAVQAGDDADAAGSLSVEVQIDGGSWQAATYNSTTERYEWSWDTTTASEGGHTVNARATDSTPLTTTTSITVTVDNVSDPPATYELVYSTSSSRSNPVALDGATVSGGIYAFTTPDTAAISVVRFYLDDPTMTGTPRRTESTAPYDFAGGTVTKAAVFSTTTIANGAHTITAAIDLTDGTTVVVHATFTVQNS